MSSNSVSEDLKNIYILISDNISIYSAENILEDFGADNSQIMMLDGSGSAQLRSKKHTIIGSDGGKGRLIPQAIGILSGVDNTTPSVTSIFDGAGSLIDPSSNCSGCNNDIAQMQPHSGFNSTVVFQWLYEEKTCNFIDLTSKNDIPVTIRVKGWDQHETKKSYKTILSNKPVSIATNSYYTTFAITSQKLLINKNKIYAKCRNYSNNTFTTIQNEVTNSLVKVNDNYFWTGTGSILSSISHTGGIGETVDLAVTFSKHKSLTSFQWYRSSSCKKLKVIDSDNITVNSNVYIKKWDAQYWKNVCTSLPCTISKDNNTWYVIKVKTGIGSTSGELTARCQ